MNVKSMIKLDNEVASFDERLFGSSDQLKDTKVYIEEAVRAIEEKRPEMKDRKIEIITEFEDGYFLILGKEAQEVTEFDT